MKRRAFLTGITGQDGSYLAEWLLEQDYEVYGLVRRTSSNSLWRLEGCIDRLHLIPGDLADYGSLARAVKLSDPNEVYHFAAQTFVSHSFEAPIHTAETTGLGAVQLFEAVRLHAPQAKLYHASSSEQFGNAALSPQDESTAFHPVSPYGCAKVFAHLMAQVYRQSYHQFIACGIAFNHESPRRGEEFVTRKITKAVAEIKAGTRQELRLGNTTACRDWSHAKDTVRGAWLMLQQETPSDYVLASGEVHSVQELVELAFNYASLDYQAYVKRDPALYRPSEIHSLVGFYAKAFRELHWRPMIRFTDLVKEMVDADLKRVYSLTEA